MLCERSTRSWMTRIACLLIATSAGQVVAGGTALVEIQSFDTDRALGASVLRDDQLLTPGSVVTVPSTGLPDAADLDAYAELSDGSVVFSTDTTVDLAGLVLGPGDVGRIDSNGVLSLEIAAGDVGLALGVGVDAVTETDDPAMPLALSFDTTVELPANGGTLVVDDEDIAKTDGVVFELFFDGSAAGLDPAVDLDGAFLDVGTDELRLTLDVSGAIDGLSFDDEDVLGYDLIAESWRLVRDGSTSVSLATGADLDAYSERSVLADLFADSFESGDTSAWSATIP